MKHLSLASLILFTSLSVSGQVKPLQAKDSSVSPATKPAAVHATRARVLKNEPAGTSSSPALQAHAKFDNSERERFRTVATEEPKTPPATAAGEKSSTQPPLGNAKTTPALPTVSLASTQVYRVGPLDVLDVQLVGNATRESTLFTVLETGVLDYPLAGAPISVVGLTVNEIAGTLRQRIKFFENPQVVVTVRDFASHRVTISGLVGSPGKKALRREAVPLYAVLAEALVLPEAARAIVTRSGRPNMVIDLKDPNHAATLIVPDDVIKVYGLPPAPTEFFYIGGAINSPGQKPFHSGITLTQAVLASGGVSANAGARVRISRLGSNGRLTSQEHNLARIQAGRIADPVLQKGDRIEIFPSN